MSIQDEIRRYFVSLIAGSSGDLGLLELIGNVRRHGFSLLMQTCELFCSESREKIQLLTRDAIILLLGVTFLWVGLLAFVTASVIVLSFFIPLWLAAVIVSLFFGFFGLALVISGIAMLRRRTIMPQLTVQALRENARWLRGQAE